MVYILQWYSMLKLNVELNHLNISQFHIHSLFAHNLILIWARPGLWGGLWSAGRPGADVHFTPLQLLLTFYGGWGTLVLTKLCYLTIFSADINPSLSASARILTRPRFSQNISWASEGSQWSLGWSMDLCDNIINVGMTSKIRQRRIYTKFTNIYWCSLCKIIAQLDTLSHTNSDIMIKQFPPSWVEIFSS